MLKKPKNNGYYRLINQRTGRIKILKHYKDGNVHGKFIYYWDNGQIHLIGQYDQMKRVGNWKTFDSNGELILEENFDTLNNNETEQLALLPI